MKIRKRENFCVRNEKIPESLGTENLHQNIDVDHSTDRKIFLGI